jgi:tRNA pseudouridine38-40 synthase
LKERNLRLTLEYDGTAYAGWQKQRQSPTVQGTLEEKIGFVCGHKVELLVAGRTDSGVHALGQTANFHTTSPMPASRLKEVVNFLLPHDIRIADLKEVPAAFHATYHAKAKLYRYIIRNSPEYTVFDRNTYLLFRKPLDVKVMKRAAQHLVGTHDFTAFRGTLGKWANPQRTLYQISITRKGKDIQFDYYGVSFLHQMIRILTGTLVYVGSGKLKPEQIPSILKSKDRKKAGPTLPPTGLFLVRVDYPKTFPPVRLKAVQQEDEE